MRFLSQRNGLFSVVAVGILLAFPLVWCGYPRGTHDGGEHINWVKCFSGQLWNGELYPRWLALPNDRFGAPSFFFYAPLPYYVAAFFWRLAPLEGQAGFALGWAAALALVLSGLAAFWCLRRFAVSKWASVMGAVVYMAAPYHFAIDLLDRGANAEFWAFVWLPLIIGALENLARTIEQTNQPRNTWNQDNGNRLFRHPEDVPEIIKISLWTACLFLTHLLTAMIFAPAIIGFALYRGWRTFRGLLMAWLIAFGLTAIYWLPMAVYSSFIRGPAQWWLETKNTMFFPSLEWNKPLLSHDVYNDRLLHIFYGFILLYAMAVLAAWILQFNRQAGRNITFCVWILGWSLVMMLPISLPIYHIISPLRDIMFSWRFMACATLAQSLLVAFLFDAFWKKPAGDQLGGFRLWLGRAAGPASLVITLCLAYLSGVERYREVFFDHGKLQAVPIVTNVFARDANGEYIPAGVNEDAVQRLFPNKGSALLEPKILEGTGQVVGTSQNARTWTWNIDVQATSPCKIIVPQFWFPGWVASGPEPDENFAVQSEASSGLVQIEVPSGRHSIDLQLSALGPEIIGKLVSLGTALGVGLTLIFMNSKRWKKTIETRRYI